MITGSRSTLCHRNASTRRILRYAAQVPGLRSLYEAYAGWNLLEDSLGAWRAIRGLSSRRPFDVIEAADTFGLGFWAPANRFRRTPILIRSHGYADPSLLGRNWPGMQFQLALERPLRAGPTSSSPSQSSGWLTIDQLSA